MRKEAFCFKSADGNSQIHAVRYMPDEGSVKAIVQIVHGMAEYTERYEEFAEYLTDRGYGVTGGDHLGHGKSVGENGFGYFCEKDPATVVVQDVHRLKEVTKQLYPTVPYIILGHSMGSFVLRNYLCLYGDGIEGAIIMGTGMQPKLLLKAGKMLTKLLQAVFDDKHVSQMLYKIAFGSYNQRFVPVNTPMDWLSTDEEKVNAYVADPLCGFVFTVNGFQTMFELIRRSCYLSGLQAMPRELPVFIVSGQDDPVGDYGKGVLKAEKALKKAGMKRLTCKLYPGARHELLNETDRKTIMRDLVNYIENNIVS